VNAEKSSGFVASRELPVLWKIARGSFLNKLIILPVAFLLSAFLPAAIVPLLLLGGVYLAFEGAEKIYAYFFHKNEKKVSLLNPEMTQEEKQEFENKRVKSAILVDFILSLEIIVIALGVVIEEPLKIQIPVVTVVAILATVGVYGIVALLVRMDDFGYYLVKSSKKPDSFQVKFGRGLVRALPVIIRFLTVLGTIAMILVAGGLFVHNLEVIHHFVEPWPIPSILAEFAVGLGIGLIALFVFLLFSAVVKKLKPTT